MKLKISDESIIEVIACVENMRESMWRLGDVLVILVDQHEAIGYERHDVLRAVAGETGCTYTFLDDHERTSRKWPKDLRSLAQDWSIYRNSSPKDIKLVERAVDENWNVTRFLEEKSPENSTPFRMTAKIISIISRIDQKSDTMPQEAREIISDVFRQMKRLGEILEGAPSKPERARCDYCGHWKTTDKCPACNEGVFELAL
jgi:rubrerythrin